MRILKEEEEKEEDKGKRKEEVEEEEKEVSQDHFGGRVACFSKFSRISLCGALSGVGPELQCCFCFPEKKSK